MGTTGHGTYARLYGDVWTNRKTLALADDLEKLGVPRRYAVREAVGQLHELLIWCLGNADDGEIGHLRPDMFARIVGWTDDRKTVALLDAWKRSGFLDDADSGAVTGWRLHDFTECASDLLAKRRARAEAKAKGRDGRRADAARPPHGGHTDAERPDNGRRADALARASGNGSGNGNDRTPTESILADAASPVGPQPNPEVGTVERPKKRRAPIRAAAPNGDAPGAPAAPSEASDASAALSVAPVAKAPTVDLCELWVQSARAAGYPAVAVNGQHAKTLADVWRAAGRTMDTVRAAVDAFFADRDAFTVRQGHSIGEFGRTSSRWLAVAAGTAPAAAVKSRQADALDAAFAEADEIRRRREGGNLVFPEELTDALPPDVAAFAMSSGVVRGLPR